ncbi:MAG: ATP-binding protein [Polyangiaceae bacterium]|nr:ATP-binding protein [Polyangiaceae bacterium]
MTAPSEPKPPSDEGIRFVGPLVELCAIGLYRPALDAICAGARDVEDPPIDRAYLLKILTEETRRQFGHPLRPLVELVLNAIDATRGEARDVLVSVSDGAVEVLDRGEGMGLTTLLSRLLVPFATDRRAGVDLGRFGVGFFSVLGIGLAHPPSFSLHVATGDGREGWSLRVIATGAASPASRAARGADDAAALMCSLRRTAPRAGTRVRVGSALLLADLVRAYLRDALHFFPPERATVRVDGVPINDGDIIEGGRRFEEVAAGAGPGGAPAVARFHLGGRPRCPGIAAATYHAGVKVEACLAVPELALIDVPGAVELTEGRDALKPGPALDAVGAAFYRRVIELAAAAREGRAARDRLAELCAQIGALMLQSAGWAESAREVAAALLGPDRYLVTPERREALLGFLGAAAAERMFVPESFWAERGWQAVLPGERELLDRELQIGPPDSIGALAAERPDLAGLVMLAARTPGTDGLLAALCRARPSLPPSARAPGGPFLPEALHRHQAAPPAAPPGPLPCLGTRRVLLIREDSPVVRRPEGWRDWYALRAAFDRAAGSREADFERDLIVGEPLPPEGPRGAGGGER